MAMKKSISLHFAAILMFISVLILLHSCNLFTGHSCGAAKTATYEWTPQMGLDEKHMNFYLGDKKIRRLCWFNLAVLQTCVDLDPLTSVAIITDPLFDLSLKVEAFVYVYNYSEIIPLNVDNNVYRGELDFRIDQYFDTGAEGLFRVAVLISYDTLGSKDKDLDHLLLAIQKITLEGKYHEYDPK